jgi:hypothetical protein
VVFRTDVKNLDHEWKAPTFDDESSGNLDLRKHRIRRRFLWNTENTDEAMYRYLISIQRPKQ